MISHEFDIAIIGGGCIGSSIAAELVGRGMNHLVLIDRGRAQTSATANSGGMIRVFHESELHRELALRNFERIGRKCLSLGEMDRKRANGSLYFFNRSRLRDYLAAIYALQSRGYACEILNGREGSDRFPSYQWNPDEQAVYEPGVFHLSPTDFSQSLIEEACRGGAQIRDELEVKRICTYRDRYRICGDGETITAKILVLAGGARLLPQIFELGIGLPLESRTLTVWEAERAQEGFSGPNFFDRESLEYARIAGGAELLLSNPKTSRFGNQIWKGEARKRSAEDCYAPGRNGVSGEIPGRQGLFLATGWGGTAFKFALEIGAQIADGVERIYPERRIHYA